MSFYCLISRKEFPNFFVDVHSTAIVINMLLPLANRAAAFFKISRSVKIGIRPPQGSHGQYGLTRKLNLIMRLYALKRFLARLYAGTS